MIRKCLLLSIVLALTLSLFACGGAAPAPPGKIAFVSDRDGNDEIYVMDADGSNQQRLTNNSHSDGLAAWSH